MAAGPVRLNLGCGDKVLDGYLNIDAVAIEGVKKPDLIHDLKEPLPFPDDHADEILAVHILEHFQYWEAPGYLRDWKRVLKPGGLLVLELPCLDKIIAAYCHALIDGKAPDPRRTIIGLFGDPTHQDPLMMHHWCYSAADLASKLDMLGFVDIEHQAAMYHNPKRDMRFVARKP
jgi:predicted SAM-dependent methyltransferase